MIHSIYHIIQHLTPSHRDAIRQRLEEESRFNKYSVSIFDSYVQGQSEIKVRSNLKLSRRIFKTFERSIEKIIFQFYNIENQTFHDLIFSSIFYGIYTSTEKNHNTRCEELEELYHNMKQMQIDQSATPLLHELKTISWNTPLETVYDHLYQKHLKIHNSLEEMLDNLTLINSNLEQITLEEKFELSKNRCLKLLSKLEKSNQAFKNNSSEAIYKIARLSLFVFSEATVQFEEFSFDTEVSKIKKVLKLLPLGIERYYLDNIFTQVCIRQYFQNNDEVSFNNAIGALESNKMIEAYNYNFPNHLTEDIIQNKFKNASKLKLINDKIYYLGPNGSNPNFERVSN